MTSRGLFLVLPLVMLTTGGLPLVLPLVMLTTGGLALVPRLCEMRHHQELVSQLCQGRVRDVHVPDDRGVNYGWRPESYGWRLKVITGFQFMANKQFRMKKRLGTSVCADISQYALKNQYIQLLYEKITPHFF